MTRPRGTHSATISGWLRGLDPGANARELVGWILADSPGWSRAEIDAVIRSGERRDAEIAKPPLYWVCLTVWATPDGDSPVPR